MKLAANIGVGAKIVTTNLNVLVSKHTHISIEVGILTGACRHYGSGDYRNSRAVQTTQPFHQGLR
jgi:hypothetical protein